MSASVSSGYTAYTPVPAQDVRQAVDVSFTRNSSPRGTSGGDGTNWNPYPTRRRIPFPRDVSGDPPTGMVFVPTGGSVSPAAPRSVMNQSSLIAVTVPEGVRSGDSIMVSIPSPQTQHHKQQQPRSPRGRRYVPAPDDRLLEAVVPPGMGPGHTFFLRAPMLSLVDEFTECSDDESHTMGRGQSNYVLQGTTPRDSNSSCGIVTVQGQDIRDLSDSISVMGDDDQSSVYPIVVTARDTNIYEKPKYAPSVTVANNDDLVLVRIPSGATPGSLVEVQVPDGRWVEATVPECPKGVREFYVRVPPLAARRGQQLRREAPRARAVAPVTEPFAAVTEVLFTPVSPESPRVRNQSTHGSPRSQKYYG